MVGDSQAREAAFGGACKDLVSLAERPREEREEDDEDRYGPIREVIPHLADDAVELFQSYDAGKLSGYQAYEKMSAKISIIATVSHMTRCSRTCHELSSIARGG